jgi:UV DNA damage endonuclease
MMEGKAKDSRSSRLRPDLLRFAPDVAARFGIYPDDAEEMAAAEKALEAGVSTEEEPDVDEAGLVESPEVEMA